MINKELKNSNLPDEIRIGAIVRGKEVIIPKENTGDLEEMETNILRDLNIIPVTNIDEVLKQALV